MIKRLFISVLFFVSLFAFSGINGFSLKANNYDCDHTFIEVTVGEKRYLYEYDCDGSLIAITELDE